MSGIFGIFHTDHSPVAPESLGRMDAAMAYWGPQGTAYLKGPVALGCRVRHITAEDRYERQPLAEGPHVLVARARLDNRSDLCRELGMADSPELPESALVLAAYRRFGADCVQHLRGDLAFALWDESTRVLLLARDATGNTGLYWCRPAGSPAVVFSLSVKGLLAHPEVQRRIDPLTVAGLLTAFSDPARAEATVYQDVRRVPPGHLLKIDAQGVAQHRWWHPERLPPLPLRSVAECDEAFRAYYEDAVAQRLRVHGGRVAATLSAGLDSGSVVALAAPQLASVGQRLKAYVHTPMYEPQGAAAHRTGNEYPLALKTAQHVGHVDAVPLRSEGISVLQGTAQALRIYDAPAFAASNEYWLTDVLQTARADGARVLLTGQGGNATVSFNGDGNLWPWLLAGRFGDVFNALHHERAGWRRALKVRLLKPLVNPARMRVRREIHRRRGGPWTGYSAIHPAFADELHLLDRMRRAGFDPTFNIPFSMRGALQAFRLGLPRGGAAWAEWMERGAAFGLDIRDPTRDQRLVEFCWRLPDDVFWGAGEQRALIRRGLHGRLPDEVLYSPRKGLQSADLGARLLAIDGELGAFIEGLRSHPLARDWLDLDHMRKTLDELRARPSPQTVAQSAQVLARGCSVGQFLETF